MEEEKIYYHIFVKLPIIEGQTSSFSLDDNGFTDITDIIADKSLKINKNLMKNFKFAQDTVKARTIYNEEINKRFFLSADYMPAYVGVSKTLPSGIYGYLDDSFRHEIYGWTEQDEGYGFEGENIPIIRIFTGAIAPLTKEKLGGNGAEGVEFEIIDNNYLLEVTCPSVTYPKKYNEKWFVYDVNDLEHSVLYDLLEKSGFLSKIIFKDSNFAIVTNENIPKQINVITIDGEEEISHIIDELLYFYHCTYYFDNYGNFCIYNWGIKNVFIPPTEIDRERHITEGDIQDKTGVERSRKFTKEDGYILEYKPIRQKANALVYRADINVDTEEGEEQGKLIAPNGYFPADPIHEPNEENPEIYPIEAYQSYSGDWLAKEAKILASYDHKLKYDKDVGLIFVNPIYITGGRLETQIDESELTFLQDKARIVLRNQSTDYQRIKEFDIRANVYFETGKATYTVPKDAKNPKKITTKYLSKLYTKNDKNEDIVIGATEIEEFAQCYYNYKIRNGQYEYKLSSTKMYQLGLPYSLETRLYTAKILPLSVNYDVYTQKYSYQCIGIDDVTLASPSESGDNIGGQDVPDVKLESFTLTPNRANFPTSSRYVTQVETNVEFTVKRNPTNLKGNVIWSYEGMEYNGDKEIIPIEKGDKTSFVIPTGYTLDRIVVTASIEGKPNLGTKTFVLMANPLGVAEPQDILPPEGEYWIADPDPDKGEVKNVPQKTNKNESLIDGDWFTNRNGVAYRYDSTKPEGKKWIKIESSKDCINIENYLNATFSSVNKALSGALPEVQVTDKTCSTYGWFKQLVALEAVVQNLIAKNLLVGTGNRDEGLYFNVSGTDENGTTREYPIFECLYNGSNLFSIDFTVPRVIIGDYLKSDGGGLIWDGEHNTMHVKGGGTFTGQLETITIETIAGGDTIYPKGTFTTIKELVNTVANSIPQNTQNGAVGTINGRKIVSVAYGNVTEARKEFKIKVGGFFGKVEYYRACGWNMNVVFTVEGGTKYVYRIKAGDYNKWDEGTSYIPGFPPKPSPQKISEYAVKDTDWPYDEHNLGEPNLFPYNVNDLGIRDELAERLYINNLPRQKPVEANRVWRDGDFLKIT